MTREEYIKKIAPIATKVCRGTGLFASTMVAQAIIESGNGNSSLAKDANNHFGIKADRSWKGAVWSGKTREVIGGKDVYITDGFRWYSTIEEGFRDRNKFLKENKRYTQAGVFIAKTPEQQAEAFQLGKYATDPNYASIIKSVINGSGKLKQYDAVEDDYKTVVAHILNLRSGAGTEHNILEVLTNGDKVKVNDTSGDWSHVTVEKSNCSGWVSSRYLS